MKKLYTTLVAVLAIVHFSYGQATNTFPTSGNVGIGTTSPNAKLDIRGDAYWGAGNTGYLSSDPSGAIELGPNTSTSAYPYFDWHYGTGAWQDYNVRLQNSANNRFDVVTASNGIVFTINGGNTGIGTTTPATRLDVTSATGTAEAAIGRFINSTNGYYTALDASGTSSNVPSWSSGSQILEFVANPAGKGIIDSYQSSLVFQTGRTDRMTIDNLGNVGIGTPTPKEALSVNGNIRSKQVKVETLNWPDYVFKKEYNLPSLSEVKNYIDQNQHLPEMPSESDVAKDGINLGEMVKLQTKKIEELTLYLIEKDKEIKDLKDSQQQQIDALKSQMQLLLKPTTH